MKLGAKWVEVRKRRDQTSSNSKMKSEFETWPATPVKASLEINELPLRPGTSRSCFLFKQTEQPGSAGHSTKQKSEVSTKFFGWPLASDF
jgi:hypothetical protein